MSVETPDDFKQRLEELVSDGLENVHDRWKWDPLYEYVAETFGISEEEIRASFLNKIGNVTNRIQKDNAWTNPTVLFCVIDPDGEVDVERVRSAVRDYTKGFAERLDATSRLRVVFYFLGSDLVAVDKVRFSANGPGARDRDDDQPLADEADNIEGTESGDEEFEVDRREDPEPSDAR